MVKRHNISNAESSSALMLFHNTKKITRLTSIWFLSETQWADELIFDPIRKNNFIYKFINTIEWVILTKCKSSIETLKELPMSLFQGSMIILV